MAAYDLIACTYIVVAIGLGVLLYFVDRNKRRKRAENAYDAAKARLAMLDPNTKTLDDVRKELKL